MLKDVEDELQRKVKVNMSLSSLSHDIWYITDWSEYYIVYWLSQSTRSRQGEQRNPEVELEVRQVIPRLPAFLFVCLFLK